MKRRVVITGMGAVTPTGNNVDTFWNSCKEGKVGIDRITKFDTSDFKVKLAAEVKDFRAADHMDPKAARRMEPFAQYAVGGFGRSDGGCRDQYGSGRPLPRGSDHWLRYRKSGDSGGYL